MTAVDARYQRAPDVLWRRFEGGVLLLGPSADEPTLVSGIGPLLWQLLATPHTAAELAGAVRDATGPTAPDHARLHADVGRVLDELAAAGLVRVE